MIVELGILELREIELRGVLHQSHAHRVGEEVAEEALDEGRRASEYLAGQHDAELEREVAPHLSKAASAAPGRNYRVDYQLSDPEGRYRYQRADDPQYDHRSRVTAVRSPDETEERGHISQRRQTLAPVSWLLCAASSPQRGRNENWVTHSTSKPLFTQPSKPPARFDTLDIPCV